MLFGYFYSDLIWLLILEVCYAYYPLRFFHAYYRPNPNLCYLPICIPISCDYWIYDCVTHTTSFDFPPKIIGHACAWICRGPRLQSSRTVDIYLFGPWGLSLRLFLCAIIKDRNSLCASEKPSNYRCEKTKMPLSSNMLLIFFERLNDFKWKNSKLESCRSRRDL